MDTTEHDALIERLARMPSLLGDVVAALPAARWTFKPAPESFSLLEHACHLRDLEAEGYQLRIRRLLAEDLPTLDEIDGSAWAIERRYQAQSLPEALNAFTQHRQATLRLLADALPQHAERKGLFGGFGIVTLAGLAREIAAHDAGHLAELKALLLLG